MNTSKVNRSKSWNDLLIKELALPERAARFLKECFEDGPDTFLLALRHLVDARGGIGALAKKTGLGRESLYKLLSGKQGGRLSSVILVLEALEIDVSFSLTKSKGKRLRKVKKLVGTKAA